MIVACHDTTNFRFAHPHPKAVVRHTTTKDQPTRLTTQHTTHTERPRAHTHTRRRTPTDPRNTRTHAPVARGRTQPASGRGATHIHTHTRALTTPDRVSPCTHTCRLAYVSPRMCRPTPKHFTERPACARSATASIECGLASCFRLTGGESHRSQLGEGLCLTLISRAHLGFHRCDLSLQRPDHLLPLASLLTHLGLQRFGKGFELCLVDGPCRFARRDGFERRCRPPHPP